MSKCEVVITVSNPAGKPVLTKKLPCLNRLDAQHLLANVSDLVEKLGQYLPGLAVAAYEVEEVAAITPAGLAALVASLPESRRNPAWLEKAAAQE